ncbi:MAG: uracil-DNA glycosylase [Thermodesulfobacteriota bacterium]
MMVMNLRNELIEILEELRIFFEFQKSLGVERVFMQRQTEGQDETFQLLQEDKPIPKTSDKPSLSANVQLNIFDPLVKEQSLEQIREEIGDCTRCKLHEGRTNIVFGEGNPKARLVFVGEGPGRDEDIQGKPFVGRAGQLLNKIIEAMGLKRSEVYICNVVKCRPPENRTPESGEIGTCEQFLFKQLLAIDPEVIVCLGSVAAQSLLHAKAKLLDLRGKFHTYGKAKLIVTYHPAALLRNPALKKPLWDDMQIVMKELGLSKSGD